MVVGPYRGSVFPCLEDFLTLGAPHGSISGTVPYPYTLDALVKPLLASA